MKTEKEIRSELIGIIARNCDEPHNTIDDIINLFMQPIQLITSENRAICLYQAGKHATEIAEILGDEYPELDGDQIDKIVNDAYELFKEKSIPLENKTND